jgi:hypothetical protein
VMTITDLAVSRSGSRGTVIEVVAALARDGGHATLDLHACAYPHSARLPAMSLVIRGASPHRGADPHPGDRARSAKPHPPHVAAEHGNI